MTTRAAFQPSIARQVRALVSWTPWLGVILAVLTASGGLPVHAQQPPLEGVDIQGQNTGGSGAGDDPCRDRPPTILDRRPEWRCVGLAQFAADGGPEAFIPFEPDLPPGQNPPQPAPDASLGVAVSPDGRLYVQTRPTPPRPIDESASFNPDGFDVEPEELQPPPVPRSGEPGADDAEPGRVEREVEVENLRTDRGVDVQEKTVFGSDTRTIRRSTTGYPWRTIGAILKAGADQNTCTGTLIGPRHVMTAGHCIHEGSGGDWYSNRKFAPGMRGNGFFPNGLKNRTWYYSVLGWTRDGDWQYDYALIVLEDHASTANLGWYGFRDFSPTGTRWLFGYPGYSNTCADSPMTGSTKLCMDYNYGDSGSVSTDGSRRLSYQIDTQPGTSGSCVYDYNGGNRQCVGINNTQSSSTNRAVRIVSAVFDNLCDWIHDHPDSHGKSHDCY